MVHLVSFFISDSVVGLNFDYLAYNITGFLSYGLFNIGMFWIPVVKVLPYTVVGFVFRSRVSIA